MYTNYEDTCSVHNTDHDKTVVADVLQFQPEARLIVSIDKSVKVSLIYNKKNKIYVGSLGGMEFTSHGPRVYNTEYTRRR